MHRIWLIARREIVAYASVPSFWVALLMGPLLMIATALGVGAVPAGPPAPPVHTVALQAPNADLVAAMSGALREAADLEGTPVRVFPGDSAVAAGSHVRLSAEAAGPALSVQGAPLSKVSLALLRRDVAAVLRAQTPRGALAAGPLDVRLEPAAPPHAQPQSRPEDPGRFGRFSMAMILWLALVGSLGMLLQAVVRERSNRALESLLSAARASEIVLGKLAGVGALATLVTGVWLLGGAAVAASPLAAKAPAAALALKSFADPAALLFGAAVFVLAFAMYGAAMIALGAVARDVAAAQNLSRPVFGVLLLVFFVGLSQVSGLSGAASPHLALLPPFAPFALILAQPGTIGPVEVLVSLAGILGAIVLCLWLAALAMKGELKLRRRTRREPATAAAAA